VDEQRLVAALMLVVASCEQVMLECGAAADLAELATGSERLRDLAVETIYRRAPTAPPASDDPPS
jgi:hypothetical protein